MAGFTLFPAETGVKLTLQRRATMIAPMRSRVSHMAFCVAVALACNEGLRPTTAAPAIRGTVTYQGHLPDSLRQHRGRAGRGLRNVSPDPGGPVALRGRRAPRYGRTTPPLRAASPDRHLRMGASRVGKEEQRGVGPGQRGFPTA